MKLKQISINKEKLTIMGIKFPDQESFEYSLHGVNQFIFGGFQPTRKIVKRLRKIFVEKLSNDEIVAMISEEYKDKKETIPNPHTTKYIRFTKTDLYKYIKFPLSHRQQAIEHIISIISKNEMPNCCVFESDNNIFFRRKSKLEPYHYFLQIINGNATIHDYRTNTTYIIIRKNAKIS